MAGLLPHTDYILGSEQMAGDDDLYSLIESSLHKQVRLYVYNCNTEQCREVGIIILALKTCTQRPSAVVSVYFYACIGFRLRAC